MKCSPSLLSARYRTGINDYSEQPEVTPAKTNSAKPCLISARELANLKGRK
jgi:hypothetical protein